MKFTYNTYQKIIIFILIILIITQIISLHYGIDTHALTIFLGLFISFDIGVTLSRIILKNEKEE